MAEHTIVLDEELEGALKESGMTAESALKDKLQPFIPAMRDRIDRELLEKAKRAQEKDAVAFEELAKEPEPPKDVEGVVEG